MFFRIRPTNISDDIIDFSIKSPATILRSRSPASIVALDMSVVRRNCRAAGALLNKEPFNKNGSMVWKISCVVLRVHCYQQNKGWGRVLEERGGMFEVLRRLLGFRPP